MARLKFHKVAAVVVLLATAAWVATGQFSSVGSAAGQASDTQTPKTEQKKEAPIRTVAVVDPPRVMHSRAIRLAGNTQADKSTTMTLRAAGIVQELPVKLGDKVKAGDLIVKLDPEGRQAAIDTARQLVTQRQAELDAAQKLAQGGNLPKLQLDSAKSALAAAQSQLEAAVADLGRTEVKAPFDGIIDDLKIEQGDTVQAGSPVATVISLDPILAIGEVSERDLKHVKIGDEAEVRLVNDNVVNGKVRFISHQADATTRTYRVEVAVDNPDGAIPAGMTAEITVHAEPVLATILPRSVVTLSENGDLGIRAVGPDNKVVFYPIDLVDDTPDGLALAGIPKDARIIVAGQELITEGDIVKPVEADQETINKLVKDATGQTD